MKGLLQTLQGGEGVTFLILEDLFLGTYSSSIRLIKPYPPIERDSSVHHFNLSESTPSGRWSSTRIEICAKTSRRIGTCGRLLLKMGNQTQILLRDQNQPVGAGFRVRPVVPHNQGRHEGRPLLKMGNQPQR